MALLNRIQRWTPLAVLLLSGSVAAQTCQNPASTCLSFSPQASVKSKATVPWSVGLCSSEDYQFAIGRVYGVLINAGLTPMNYQTAVAAITAKQQRSVAARIATWAGYAAAGVSVLMAIKAIQARPAWEEGVTAGAGALSVIVPLATHAEPNIGPLLASLARDSDALKAPAGGCDNTVVVATPGKAFNVELPKDVGTPSPTNFSGDCVLDAPTMTYKCSGTLSGGKTLRR